MCYVIGLRVLILLEGAHFITHQPATSPATLRYRASWRYGESKYRYVTLGYATSKSF